MNMYHEIKFVIKNCFKTKKFDIHFDNKHINTFIYRFILSTFRIILNRLLKVRFVHDPFIKTRILYSENILLLIVYFYLLYIFSLICKYYAGYI